ncbi:hypothetical protein JHK85_006912 [Glycine max]|nr:hypothetical protein JHK85_006912 [Glycine max]
MNFTCFPWCRISSSGAEVFWKHISKRMLLCPCNPCEALCCKLKLKIDDTGPIKYFMCNKVSKER